MNFPEPATFYQMRPGSSLALLWIPAIDFKTLYERPHTGHTIWLRWRMAPTVESAWRQIRRERRARRRFLRRKARQHRRPRWPRVEA